MADSASGGYVRQIPPLPVTQTVSPALAFPFFESFLGRLAHQSVSPAVSSFSKWF